MKIYKVSYWYPIATIQEVDTIEHNNYNVIVQECTCGNKFFGEKNDFPKYKWDKVKEEYEAKGITGIMFYGNNQSFKSDNQTCECGNRFDNMKLIYPVAKESVTPYFRSVYKNEPELDESYINNPIKEKRWHDFDGKMEEFEDVHHATYDDVYGVKKWEV